MCLCGGEPVTVNWKGKKTQDCNSPVYTSSNNDILYILAQMIYYIY